LTRSHTLLINFIHLIFNIRIRVEKAIHLDFSIQLVHFQHGKLLLLLLTTFYLIRKHIQHFLTSLIVIALTPPFFQSLEVCGIFKTPLFGHTVVIIRRLVESVYNVLLPLRKVFKPACVPYLQLRALTVSVYMCLDVVFFDTVDALFDDIFMFFEPAIFNLFEHFLLQRCSLFPFFRFELRKIICFLCGLPRLFCSVPHLLKKGAVCFGGFVCSCVYFSNLLCLLCILAFISFVHLICKASVCQLPEILKHQMLLADR